MSSLVGHWCLEPLPLLKTILTVPVKSARRRGGQLLHIHAPGIVASNDDFKACAGVGRLTTMGRIRPVTTGSSRPIAAGEIRQKAAKNGRSDVPR